MPVVVVVVVVVQESRSLDAARRMPQDAWAKGDGRSRVERQVHAMHHHHHHHQADAAISVFGSPEGGMILAQWNRLVLETTW